ncbi:MAG: ankyrin repeat domain-containing protein [Pirellulaceae bacterium]
MIELVVQKIKNNDIEWVREYLKTHRTIPPEVLDQISNFDEDQIDMVWLLEDTGVDKDLLRQKIGAHFLDYFGDNAKQVKRILQLGLSPDQIDLIGRTPLFYACYHGRFDVAKILLEFGANPNHRDIDNFSLLFLLILIKHDHAENGFLFLADHGADIFEKLNDNSFLHLSARSNFLRVMTYLLEKGVDPNICPDASLYSPLHVAARHGNLEACKLLVEYGADVNSRNIEGFTPLDNAKIYNRDSVIDYLNRIGARSSQTG